MPDSHNSAPRHASDEDEVHHLLHFVRDSRDRLVVPAGSVLFREGEPGRGAYYVEEGELHLTVTSAAREHKLAIAKPGCLLGMSSVVSNCEYQCTAHAVYGSRLTFIPAEELRSYLRVHPEICLLTVQRLASELLELGENTIRPSRLQPRKPSP